MNHEVDGVKQIKEDELQRLLQEGKKDRIFIDVREVEEYDEAHIPGVPLIPMSTFPAHVKDLDKDKEYVLICRSGGRSQNVACYLKDQGIDNVVNFSGGMLSWSGDVKDGSEWIVKDTKEIYQD